MNNKRVSPQLQSFAMAQEQRHDKAMQVKARQNALASFVQFVAFVALAYMLYVIATPRIAQFLSVAP